VSSPSPETSLRVRIRLFAVQRELVGMREVSLDLPPAATVEDAWTALVKLHPELAPGRSSTRFAVNGQYTTPRTALAEGDEIAMIPPVSGGAADADGVAADIEQPGRILEIRAEPFDAGILDDLARRLASEEDGAVVAFLGITRRTPGTPAPGQEVEVARHEGRSVELLDYEALEPMALRILGEIADEIRARFAVERLAIVHRTGEVPLGEASVAIVACAPHRGAAFAAAAYAIDETKARAPIWKAEHFADGHIWIGEPAREASRGC